MVSRIQNVALLPPVGPFLPCSLSSPYLFFLLFLPFALLFFSSMHLSPPLSPRVFILSSDYFSPFPVISLPSSLLFFLLLLFSHPAFLLQAGGQGQGTPTLILCGNPCCFSLPAQLLSNLARGTVTLFTLSLQLIKRKDR